jgi:hypothetical protein
MLSEGQVMRIAVIIDDLDASRRRRCFWDEQLSGLPDVEYELISLLQKMEAREFFNVYAFDVVIFNWCVLDGALMYASDRVQDIVEFYDDHFIQFVRKGGILIMENQPKRWRPVQRAYDILLKGDIKVISRETYMFGSKVILNERLRRHPLFQHLPVVMYSAYAHAPDESWFPPGSTSAKSIQELNPTKVYSGAFQSWKSDWLPVLYADDKAYPVMLIKTEGLGIWIVTTMYLASSNIKELIESIIVGSKRHCVEIQRYHSRQLYIRKLELLRVFIIFLAIAGGIYAVLATRIVIADVPYGSTFIGNISLSVILAIAASMLTFLRKYIWKSIRAAFNK